MPGPMRRWLKRLCLCLLGGCLLLGMAWVFRAPLLRGAARAWIVNDKLEQADAIVVLGGGLQTRPFEAARLYHQGLAPKILLLKTRMSPTDELGITKPQTQLAGEALTKQDVPSSAVEVIGEDVASTFDESLAVQKWVADHHPHRLIIPTELFHTRRVDWIFARKLRKMGVQVSICAITPPDYSATDWWHQEEGLINFQNEVIKFGFYFWKY